MRPMAQAAAGGYQCGSSTRNPTLNMEKHPMAKISRGGRMTAAKKRAAKSPGGKGPVKNRPAGRRIMST